MQSAHREREVHATRDSASISSPLHTIEPAAVQDAIVAVASTAIPSVHMTANLREAEVLFWAAMQGGASPPLPASCLPLARRIPGVGGACVVTERTNNADDGRG